MNRRDCIVDAARLSQDVSNLKRAIAIAKNDETVLRLMASISENHIQFAITVDVSDIDAGGTVENGKSTVSSEFLEFLS